MDSLGWNGPSLALSAFARPFDTWGDMRHLIERENLPEKARAIAYFCSALEEQTGTRGSGIRLTPPRAGAPQRD